MSSEPTMAQQSTRFRDLQTPLRTHLSEDKTQTYNYQRLREDILQVSSYIWFSTYKEHSRRTKVNTITKSEMSLAIHI